MALFVQILRRYLPVSPPALVLILVEVDTDS